MSGLELALAVLMAIGLVGVVVPFVPGTLLIAIAVAGWAISDDGRWLPAVVALAILGTGTLVKYLVPAKRMRDSGVPTLTIVVGAFAGVAGFFLIPVVGLPVGFVLGIYLMQRLSGPHEVAWASTKAAVIAIGVAVAIELTAGLLAIVVWLIGAFAS